MEASAEAEENSRKVHDLIDNYVRKGEFEFRCKVHAFVRDHMADTASHVGKNSFFWAGDWLCGVISSLMVLMNASHGIFVKIGGECVW